MPDDLMRYDLLAQNALKGVVREALRIAETQGLPGEHHFYIAFNTRAPGVELSEKIAARYPREMTIVLQHQYWNLKVHDDRFEVEVSFDNVPEHLVIPFDAVKGFLDPAVQFGLQFETQAAPRPREVEQPKPAAAKAEPQPAPAIQSADGKPEKKGAAQDEAAKVVSLDQFRKK
ncbi:ClpXP protease specificity-enhancing factor SspB [Aestuariivirga sp.]|uniref:SspB family protein n=1 Tax=Aestuariivirga sp. TaxID=2650926 RepID=UPI0025BF6116|nr:ClpXP protease specificity-enhancing factor SspB [Aestuariivirga sp.]MCA3556096.1 hypothetical protein [Aestuariivirga sp.]